MRVDLFGLGMEAPAVTFYLWSPWRCSLIEHKLFDALKSVPNANLDPAPDEIRLHIADAKGWRVALQNLSRVLKGWQEEAADVGNERRSWRWFVEADVDANGYDLTGEKASLWLFLRLSIDRGGPGEADKGEDIEMMGFGVQVWGEKSE